MLATSKLNSIETWVSKVLVNVEINQEEFIMILKKKDKYEKVKENVRNANEKLKEKTEKARLNSVNWRTCQKMCNSAKKHIKMRNWNYWW